MSVFEPKLYPRASTVKSAAAFCRRYVWFGLVIGVMLVAQGAKAEEVVFEYKGSASRSTPDFEVEAPWILDWRVTIEGSYESAVDISLEQAGTGIHQGQVLTTKYPGNGVRLFRNSGKFNFRVNSSFATWTLKVIELTEEEAAAYTPRNRSVLDP